MIRIKIYTQVTSYIFRVKKFQNANIREKRGKWKAIPQFFLPSCLFTVSVKKMTKNVRFFLLFPEKPYICRLKMNQEQINY